jgi:hypothetical protein
MRQQAPRQPVQMPLPSLRVQPNHLAGSTRASLRSEIKQAPIFAEHVRHDASLLSFLGCRRSLSVIRDRAAVSAS